MTTTGRATTATHPLADEHCKDAIIDVLPGINSEAGVSR